MDQDNLAGRLATKRKLGFLKTFDKRIEGLIREKERLQKSLVHPDALGNLAWLDNVERIVRGFVGAGPVYGINAVSDWAKATLSQIAQLRDKQGEPGEEDLLWLASITQEIKLLHSEAMAEIEEKFGIAAIQETPSVIPPGTDTGLQSRSTLPPPEEKTVANPPPGAPTRVAKLPLRQAAPGTPVSAPPPLASESNKITPITEDDIVTEIPDEVLPAAEPPEPVADDLADAGQTQVMPDRQRFSAPRIDTLPPSSAPPPKPPRAAAPKPPRPASRQPRPSSPQLPRPSASAPSAVEPSAPPPDKPSEDAAANDKDPTTPLASGDLHELPDSAFTESLPPGIPNGSVSGLSRSWAVAMGITWAALLISLYFNWRSYLAEPQADEGYVRAVGESAQNPGPYPSGATDVSGVVPRIAIREAPAQQAEPDAAAPGTAPAAASDRVPVDAGADRREAEKEPPEAKPEEPPVRRPAKESKEPAGEAAAEDAPAPKSAPAVSPSDSAGVLSILVPPNAAGPVAIEVDKRARGVAPLKIRLGPGLHELVQSYQGKRSMRIVLIRKGKTNIVTAKIPD